MTNPAPDSRFTFDPRLSFGGRYRSPSGRILSERQARAILDRTLDSAGNPIQALSQQLRDGNVRLEDWRLQMQRQIKNSHISSAALQRGGIENMTQSDWGRVGAEVRRQYQYLEGFTREIADGTQRLDGTLQRRAQMYVDAGRTTYHRFEQVAAVDMGMTEERSVLSPADHCQGCLDEAAKGWQPIGQMVPIGRRDCRSNDRCTVEYR